MASTAVLPPLPSVSQILKIYNVRARKHLAQNFLFDPRIIDRLVSCAGTNLRNKHVCEIGPGAGGITRAILKKNAESLLVVEKDPRFIQSLQMLANATQGRMVVRHADILDFDLRSAFTGNEEKDWMDSDLPDLFFIGNLPFNISLPLLFKLLNSISHRSDVYELGRIPAVLTFQHEVAERLISLPSDKQRSRLSVTAQYLCDVRYCFAIRGASFIPPPKVDVGVVRLIPKKEFDIQLPFETVDHVVKHVFHFRQKYCYKGIRTLFPRQRDDLLQQILKNSGINPEDRPYKLQMNHFRDLCYAYQEICERIPQLRLVDTYDNKSWLKLFDESGEPRESYSGPNSNNERHSSHYMSKRSHSDVNLNRV